MHTAMQRLAPVDEANLVLDHRGQVNVFLVAGLLASGGFIAEDGTPDMDELRASLRDRIAALPALCRVAAAIGRRHHWVEASPDLQVHIRLVEELPGLAGLQHACAELMVRPLARDRPLWELLVMPVATAGAIGFVLRIHHAIADGMAAVSIVQHLFDPAGPQDVPPEETARPSPGPPRGRGPGLWRQLRVGVHRIRKSLFSRDVGPTVLLGERSQHRGVAFLSAELAGLEASARPMGATVNDALLAAVTAGFRTSLASLGERTPEWLPVSVPVALHRRGGAANQVGVMLVRLPVAEPDPDRRLTLISAQTREEKVRAREQGTLEFMRGPIGARILDGVARGQRLVAGFVTNVPGPAQGTLRLAGARIAALWPVGVLSANVRLGVAAVSYDGRLCCSVHFDAANVPGDTFARAMEQELRRLGA